MEKVTWLPADPVEGSVSMQRYWHELWRVAKARGMEGRITSPLGEPSYPVERASRWKRAYRNYLAYPREAAREVGENGIVHILDHSYAHLAAGFGPEVRVVVTVHDLIPLREREGLSDAQLRRIRERVGWVRRADRVVAVSDFTRGDIVKFLGVERERIEVIPNGTAFGEVEEERPAEWERVEGWGREGLFRLLVVGSAVPRKNLGMVSEVVQRLEREGIRCAVVKAGSAFPSIVRERLEREIGADRMIGAGLVSDGTLKWLYGACDVMFFPSKLEGFGLPVVEALGCGCPVVCSGAASLPEAGGDAAYYFDFSDADAAAAKLLEVVRSGDADLRERVERGREWGAGFTWERHFDGLLGVYDGLERAG
ncbi:MAG: glycosyltransferase family 1 protein [Verrucomicrobiota bacterium]